MINGKEIHVLDLNAEYHGVPTIKLMENAGKQTANFIINDLKLKKKKILIICGTGNNGGDGFVAARYLSNNYEVTVLLTGQLKDIKTEISKKNLKKLKAKKITVYEIDSCDLNNLIDQNEIIIDSMLGIGLSGDLREPYKKIVNQINKTKNKTIISVDVPTGLGTKTSVKPEYTITFHCLKEGMNNTNCGKIKTVDIGIPKKAENYVGPGEIKTFYPIPKKKSHKGDNGTLLIVGGGPYYGAPALSSFAAQRTGVDLVYIFTPKKVARAITSYSPNLIKPVKLAKNLSKIYPTLIVQELSDEEQLNVDDIKIIKQYFNKSDALLIGPGIGDSGETQKAVENLITTYNKQKKPIIVDADAIKVIGKNPDIIKNSKTVLTPHTGEFKELTGVKLSDNLKDRIKQVEKWSKKLNVTIALKGPIDIISNGELTKLNDVHNEAMTVGGTGDVLAGITGALLAKKISPFNSARMAVFICGEAGNMAFKKKSYGLIATDVIDEISNVLKKYL